MKINASIASYNSSKELCLVFSPTNTLHQHLQLMAQETRNAESRQTHKRRQNAYFLKAFLTFSTYSAEKESRKLSWPEIGKTIFKGLFFKLREF